MVVGLLVLAIVGTATIWVGARWLEPSAAQIAQIYELPALVHGAVLVAAASSFPEFASVVLAAARYGEFELGVAAIIGSAVFNVLVIPAAAAYATDVPVDANRELIFKDAQFYLLAVVVTFLTFALAVVYFPVENGTAGTINRWLALVPLVLYVMYLLIHYLDMVDIGAAPTSDAGLPRALLGFGGGIVVILIGVEALLYASIELGATFQTPAFLWGLTVVAIGTSIPDLFVSVRAIRARRPIVSLSNVFGSNVFDLLVAIPAGVLVAGSTVVHFERAVPMFTFLIVATVAAMVALRTAFELTTREAHVLMMMYVAFIGWIALEAVGIVSLLA